MKTPFTAYTPRPTFQILSDPPFQPPIQLLFSLPCFFAISDMLFYVIILWIYTCGALVLEYQKKPAVCFMQEGIKFTEA